DYLAQDARVDLINLSLASDLPSEILRDALIDARDQGTLPIAAAGNAGVASPAFPAAFPEAPAVAALGQLGQIPADALSADNHPRFLDRYGVGGWFLARFSNYGGWPSWGSAVAVAAPGVGIVSTVPDVDDRKESFAARSGTSMATPMTCGALATRLAADGDYRKLSRGRHRADRAEAILRAATLPIGTWPFFVGCGLPRAA
ncbi:MAG: S8 family serine peptidase, partial [Acidobacteriota bacterium]